MAPTKTECETLCSHLSTSDPSPFFDRVSPDVVWDVMEAWKQGALGTINRILREPLALKVVNVVGGGTDQDWAVVELEANAVCKNGMPYPQRYAWVMRFDESGSIVQVRAYLDSALVQKAVDSNS
ncbi:hypothetical protein KC340_g4639 [Hortaea werneckii]|nr:hypothetical protein KC342_g12981 [Hortaea werneckii]KAI7097407.1 hypothetical protein KC339_g9707 [Hortaea werneckii]KAI7329496.1 hypothetical protein KC340_g4639 [Hortaea werneckii]KAI7404605.1 hypothetical protein KC328_g1885 [Hortaea werneckii]